MEHSGPRVSWGGYWGRGGGRLVLNKFSLWFPEHRAGRAGGPPCPLHFHPDQGAHRYGHGEQASLSGPSTGPRPPHPLPTPRRCWLLLCVSEVSSAWGQNRGMGLSLGAKPGDGAQPGGKAGRWVSAWRQGQRRGLDWGQSWGMRLSLGAKLGERDSAWGLREQEGRGHHWE